MVLLFENENSQRQRFLAQILKELGYKNVREFQKDKALIADGIVGLATYNAIYSTYLNVENVNFEGHYYKVSVRKKQIVLHHSAGWDNARLMFDVWRQDRAFHVATAIGIEDSGKIIRGYDESFWAVHIGAWDIGLPNFVELEQASVGVEICNWGALDFRNGKFYAWQGSEIPQSKVIELNYKGVRFYEAYTDAEIESTRRWIMLMALRFSIPIKYNFKDFFEVSKNATSGAHGLYTHNSYVSWKTDISPQPKMLSMLEKFNTL